MFYGIHTDYVICLHVVRPISTVPRNVSCFWLINMYGQE
jgi:hypothetical protein